MKSYITVGLGKGLVDHIFTLKQVAYKVFLQQQLIFAIIDIEKVFDIIPRNMAFQKCLSKERRNRYCDSYSNKKNSVSLSPTTD